MLARRMEKKRVGVEWVCVSVEGKMEIAKLRE
jgi:hypothetical protein